MYAQKTLRPKSKKLVLGYLLFAATTSAAAFFAVHIFKVMS
jgi:hypothetical protein